MDGVPEQVLLNSLCVTELLPMDWTDRTCDWIIGHTSAPRFVSCEEDRSSARKIGCS